MFEKKLEAGRHILTGKPIPLMRDGEEISGGYARWARAGRYSSSRPEGLFVFPATVWGMGMAFSTASGYTVGATTGEGV